MGPLAGIRIIELAGIGPGPFCGMMLADMGAEVIKVDRPGGNPFSSNGHEVLFRSRRNVAVNLKAPEGVEVVLRLCEKADALFEGYRPGVAEKLGVGPEACLARNPKLVYGRMTGWGQYGPLAHAAGHDINYIALSGALHALGRQGERPLPPLNLVGDFGGGGLMMAYGIVCALLEAARSGQGQVIDCSMVEGSAALMAMFSGLQSKGMFTHERGTNLLDGGAPFYDTYETADGKYVGIGSLEPQFYALLLEKAGLDAEVFGGAAQFDFGKWPELRERLTRAFQQKTRDEWCAVMEGSDVCFGPVLSLAEAPEHPHNKARGSFVVIDGMTQHAPTPRMSRTPPPTPRPGGPANADTDAVLEGCGFTREEIGVLKAKGAVA